MSIGNPAHFIQRFWEEVTSHEVRARVGTTFAFPDSVLQIEDDADATKTVALSVGGLATATSRTLTVPDASGVLPVPQLVRADAAFTLTNGVGAQAMFAAAAAALTVKAGQSYRFRVVARLTTGAVSAAVSFLFGGTATFTTVNYVSHGINAASGAATASAMNNGEAATAVVVVAAGTGVNKRFQIEGEFEVNAAGTLIPQIQFSADPTGTLTTDVGSFFEAWPIGAAPVTAIGAWA